MGLLTILKKMKQKEKEVRLLMLYPLWMIFIVRTEMSLLIYSLIDLT